MSTSGSGTGKQPPAMRWACIDIGSNTTRLLVAERRAGVRVLQDVAADRAFTCLGAGRAPDGSLDPVRIAAVAAVVAEQAAHAHALGVMRLRVVATAAVRTAPNRRVLCSAVEQQAGVRVEVIAAQEEAGLAFAGAIGTLGSVLGATDQVGVVDVGGGSTELICGTTAVGPSWIRSVAIGSGTLTERHLHGDRPHPDELARLRAEVRRAFTGLEAPTPGSAFAVGGSATSLGRLTGGRLDGEGLERALEALCSGPVAEVAERLALHPHRVRMLPAAVIVLAEASRALGVSPRIAPGGLREGVILALARRHAEVK